MTELISSVILYYLNYRNIVDIESATIDNGDKSTKSHTEWSLSQDRNVTKIIKRHNTN